MCGIAGIKNFPTNYNIHKTCDEIINCLKHRGPDNNGKWVNMEQKVAFCHTRLSIIDESNRGSQPMISKNKRWTIVYNGEIYNFLELRKELEELGIIFNGNSDTEVILECVSNFGVERSVKKFIGMFAIGLFDNSENKIYLIRDRVGIKPLYWGQKNNIFMFSSELQSFKKFKNFHLEIDAKILNSYLKFGYIPSPYSIYKDIFKLNPGHILEIDNNNISNIYKYWDLKSNTYKKELNKINFNNSLFELKELLKDSVTKRMISDVEIGSLLSGGIDSSIVTSIMQENSLKKVKTFSVGFDNSNYDESANAKLISNHLGTDHHEIQIDSKNLINFFPEAIESYDEPFADSSQIPTFLISKFIRKNIKVALSGDGGDEIFGGYNRYLWTKKILTFNQNTPSSLLIFISFILDNLSKINIDNFFNLLPNKYNIPQASGKIKKISDLLRLKDLKSIYYYLINQVNDPHKILFKQDKYFHSQYENFNSKNDVISNLQFIDFFTYLPDDILTKVDRASMANSLEIRVPLIDHRIIEFMSSQPLNYKIAKGESKIMLREILKQYMPEKLFNRPKMGFAVPINSWLKGPLRNWSQDILNSSKVKNLGIFNYNEISKRVKDFENGKKNMHYEIWTILILHNWLMKNL